MLDRFRVLVADGTSSLGTAIVKAFATQGASVGFCGPIAAEVACLSKHLILRNCNVVGLPVNPAEEELFCNWVSDHRRLFGNTDIFAFTAPLTRSGAPSTTYLTEEALKHVTIEMDRWSNGKEIFGKSQLFVDVVSVHAKKLTKYESANFLPPNLQVYLPSVAPESLRINIECLSATDDNDKIPNPIELDDAIQTVFLIANSIVRRKLLRYIKWSSRVSATSINY